MKTTLRLLVILLVLFTSFSLPAPARAASPAFAVVTWGDSLHHIAARYGLTAEEVARANKLPSITFVYAGQVLLVPDVRVESAALESNNAAAPITSVYTVRYGDTLYAIATRNGVSIQTVMNANGLRNPNFIYSGQRLNIPVKTSRASQTAAQPQAISSTSSRPSLSVNVPLSSANRPINPPSDGKWIDVDIGDQTITAYQGSTPLKKVLVSTGVAWHPTPFGHYKVYTKITSQTMSGGYGSEYYSLPGVPWIMYFYSGYAIHGTYWHSNFGHPMSHGCVNLTIADAKWFFDWAEIGTPVVTHP